MRGVWFWLLAAISAGPVTAQDTVRFSVHLQNAPGTPFSVELRRNDATTVIYEGFSSSAPVTFLVGLDLMAGADGYCIVTDPAIAAFDLIDGRVAGEHCSDTSMTDAQPGQLFSFTANLVTR